MMKQTIWKILTVLLVSVLASSNLFGVIWGNDLDSGFDGAGTVQPLAEVRGTVIRGAAHFLDAYSFVLVFMNRIECAELEGVDVPELRKLIGKAVESINAAAGSYVRLEKNTAPLPYNAEIINRLARLDFENFKVRHRLNGEIFQQVQLYLSGGDIRGVCRRLSMDISTISRHLTQMKEVLDGGGIPGIEEVWQLNHTFSSSLLFGQYVAMVFGEIRNRQDRATVFPHK